MNEDRVEGTAGAIKGGVKEGIGALAGDVKPSGKESSNGLRAIFRRCTVEPATAWVMWHMQAAPRR